MREYRIRPLRLLNQSMMPGTKAVSPLYREPVGIHITLNLLENFREDVNELKTALRGLNLRDPIKLFR